MKTDNRKRNVLLPALALILTVTLPSFAQESGTNQPPRPENQQPAANQDAVEGLQLTGEQRASIRAIRVASRDEQMAANQRLRKARLALEDALDAEYPNEALVEQLAKEVGEAQFSVVRIQALREVRIRRILTPEQQAKLRELRHNLRDGDSRREQRIQKQIDAGRRSRNLPNQGNGMAPREQLRDKNLPSKPQ